ncbi:uncharacterized protein LOC111304877 [Durio zibethinus]|uniref:Uncharacterized protein LOC111304877 n=1 Tax=Durio zibethinus TaxID=66656 RepID=A0A6P5ZYL4_DURZI|nr:uncharacterized protein LOC111304877 [Durio zibethinus]
MWWATSLTPVGPYFPVPMPIPKPTKHQPHNVSANFRLSSQPAASNRGNNFKQEEGKEISGSDVLWALQRAAAQKKKAKRRKKGSAPSKGSHREKDGTDYGNVRPLQIKNEWSLKLDELEKRLQELEETT